MKKEIYKLSKEWVESKDGQPVDKEEVVYFKYKKDALQVLDELQDLVNSLATKENPCIFYEPSFKEEKEIAILQKSKRLFDSADAYFAYIQSKKKTIVIEQDECIVEHI